MNLPSIARLGDLQTARLALPERLHGQHSAGPKGRGRVAFQKARAARANLLAAGQPPAVRRRGQGKRVRGRGRDPAGAAGSQRILSAAAGAGMYRLKSVVVEA